MIASDPQPDVAASDEPAVTVLMPVYNAARFLSEAVQSILHQSWRNLELLVIDDGSTDDSRAILRGVRDPRLRVEANPRNLGLIATLNRGIELARGRYLARMDADDVSLPERLACQVAYLEAHPEVGGVSGGYEAIDAEGRLQRDAWGRHRPLEAPLVGWSLFFGTFFCHGAAMFRREVFRQVGRFDPAFAHAEDYELWLRLSAHVPLVNLPTLLLRVRTHGGNVSQAYRELQRANALHALGREVEALLGEKTPAERLRYLREGMVPVDPAEAAAVGRLLALLCRAYLAKARPPAGMRRRIEADTAMRLAALAVGMGPRHAWAAANLTRRGMGLHAPAFTRMAWARWRTQAATQVLERSPLFATIADPPMASGSPAPGSPVSGPTAPRVR